MKPDYSARSNRPLHPTSLNTAPATQNSIPRFLRKSVKTLETSFPMQGRSENDPTSPQPASQVRLRFKLCSSIFYCKMQRFAPNLTFKHSPSAAPATKSDTWTSPNTVPATKSDTRTSPSTAPATKSDTRTWPSTAPATKSNTWPSPSTAPATKNDTKTSPSTAPATKSNTWPSPNNAPARKSDTHGSSSWHMKPHLQCAEQQMSPSKLTKYCACHAKWPPNIWQKFAENSWNVISNVISNAGPIRP